jgi:hypothetical protein
MEATPVSYLRLALVLLLCLHWNLATAQAVGEAAEPSPEELDAAFSSEDAAREAAAFSDTIIGQGALDPLQQMTDAADLIFRGNVSSQSFVYDAGGIPHTHTTFVIAEIIKGRYPNGEITLVQEGGPAQDQDDRILMVSSSVLFNPSDEELLFIHLDPDNPIEHERATVSQRYRIYEGKVYSEDGRGITVEPVEGGSGRRLVLSDDRHPAAYFRQIRIGDHTLTRNFGRDSEQRDSVPDPEQANAHVVSIVRSYADGVDVETFSDAIAQ